MTEQAALYERRGHIGIVTLNRPHALNAVNAELSAGAGNALAGADADPEVRAIVITGAGRAFCAGADLKEIAQRRRIDAPEHPEWGFAGIVRHWVATPTIAAVNGFAFGGGTEIVLACDLAVADEKAELGLPEVKRGLLAAAGGVIRLPRVVPVKIALEIGLTGRPVPAGEAAQLGLVNRVAPEGKALEVALELAEAIAANAPVSVRETKRVMYQSREAGSDWGEDAWALNDQAVRRVMSSADSREGPRAFAEKRAPRWAGR